MSYLTRALETWLCADDGGGMDPEAMRRCMSFGFSDKKSKSVIGQCTTIFSFSKLSWFCCCMFIAWDLCCGFQMVMASRPVLWDLGQMLLSSAAI